ncbi:3-hydroxyacyl-CoA dehydrogenase NAD-binding domain-containing protein [Halopenitus sp. POP-27]|uniref:3-hydroxyacyl-CoA dehydrogenase/enoyl-CoA hydratase family protein n=1 Tax=Halopenitus sp. POP-27 TaxID=2994425 RepID=UPI0024692439|nr:3-hydroxyacyl-CoA dehydrogenase NAD-binding domain-containing protein [Halopenitus sp. POP-27]
MRLADVDLVTVLGAGNMGHGIAELAALAGYEVRMRDITEEFVHNGYERIEWSLGKLAEKDRLTDAEAEAALDRVTPLVDVEAAVEDADVVIEAVPETLEIKTDVYTEIERYAPEDAVFASNTSSISITDLSELTDRPARFCGMHFFNPPVRMELVEVIAGAHTDPDVLELIEGLAESFGKTPVRVRKDSPGFIVNRVLMPLLNEAAWIVNDGGATMAAVDSTAKFDIGLPMGPFELADRIGIDVAYHVLKYLQEELGDAYRPSPLIVERVEADELGKKSDVGFYDYENDGATIPADAGDDTIRHRLLAVMANEVAGLIERDVADVEAIDEAVTLGAGFPQGPARLADEAGVGMVLEVLRDRYEKTGADRYRPTDELIETADRGGFYADADDVTGSVSRTNYETLDVRVTDEGVGRVTIDRPHRMNTITEDLLTEFDAAIDELAANENARAVLVTGAGDRAFSAGADVQSIAASGADPIEITELSKRGQETLGRLERIGMPVVAGINGYCLGGGMELAAAADIWIASVGSEFGQTEHNLGIMPGWGGTQRLPRIVGEGQAKEIIFTADRYDAETMAEYGFLNEVVDSGDLEDRSLAFATDLAAGPPIAQRYTKRAIHAGRTDAEAGLAVEAQAFGQLMSTEDVMTGMTAFMSDEEPEFEGE